MQFPPELYRLCESPRKCSYLPAEIASLEYRAYRGLDPAQLEHLLARGWRRFGIDVFRPACTACTQCVPIRVDVRTFRPDKNQRRTRKKNADVSVTIGPAHVTPEHVQLYNAWHRDMTARKAWPEQSQTVEHYAHSFLNGDFPSLHEMQYRRGEELIGVGIVDVLPHSLSSVYFYHAPEWRDLSPGTFSLLCEIYLAELLKLDYVYLGYWVSACPSMAYKNRFHPHQVLLSRPADDVEPAWLKPALETLNVPTSKNEHRTTAISGEQDGPADHD